MEHPIYSVILAGMRGSEFVFGLNGNNWTYRLCEAES